MARAEQEAIVLIVDKRRNNSKQNGADLIIPKVKEVAKSIIVRKIFAKSKDDVAVVVLGSKYSNNSVDENLSYENIEVLRDLQQPSWEMVKDVETGWDTPTACGGDILEAFVVALSVLRNKDTNRYASQKIVLVSEAHGESSYEGLDMIIEEMKRMGTEVTVIGPNISEDTQSQTEDGKLDESIVVARIAVETEGLVCRFEDALENLTKFGNKKVKLTPWKVLFEIGPDLTIPVQAFIKISPADDIKPKSEHINEEDGSRAEKDYVYTADEKPVEKEDIIEGFSFGGTIVPFSADEKSVYGYQSGPKSLKLLYFTSAENVPKHLCIGTGTSYVFPAEERAKEVFSAFVHAMAEEGAVAIARRVYNNNYKPTLLMLTPKIREDYECLVSVTLPYADDVKRFSFGPLTTTKSKPSPEQLKAVDDLISSMNLMEVPDEYGECDEAFDPESTHDPCQQHLYEVICDRALNPDKREILEPSDNVLKMLQPPASIQQRIEPLLEKVKVLFPLKEIKPKEGPRKSAADAFNDESDLKAEEIPAEISDAKPSTMKKIGTITPVRDFHEMLEDEHISFKEVCGQMQDVIWNCVELAFDLDDMKKMVSCVKALRTVCVERDPDVFNSWVIRLKNDLPTLKRSFLKLLMDENIALITREETDLSAYGKEEAGSFLRQEDVEMKERHAENECLDDLLNEM